MILRSILNFNGLKGTNLANGTASSDAAAFGQIATAIAAASQNVSGGSASSVYLASQVLYGGNA